MAYQPSQKLVDYAIIGGILLAGAVVWSKFFAKAPDTTCPAGTHYVDVCADADTGLGKWLCNAGRNLLGGGLDCKPDEIVCLPGYTVQNGQCTATLPGGCTITNEDCKTADPRTYLNLDTCECTSSNYTDECTLGTNDCVTDPFTGKKKVMDCIFVEPFGNRWQFVDPPIFCGGEDVPVVPVWHDPCGVSECEPGVTACFENVSHRCVSQGTGCEDRGIWSIGGNACQPATNIVDCGNGCGLVDLNNPPGTTCEQVCSSIWTPGCVQDYNECLRLQQVNPGGQLRGFMNAQACAAMGGQPEAGGYCRNQAARDLDALRAAACCW
jgi:hypothetical protein